MPFKITRVCYRRRFLILTAILFIQFYAGIKLYVLDFAQPFSNISKVAEYIKVNGLEESTIVATSDLTVFPISAWLDKQIYYPETASFGTFTVWTPESTYRNSNISETEIVQQIKQLSKENSDRMILVTDKKLQQPDISNLTLLNSLQQPNLLALKFFIYSTN